MQITITGRNLEVTPAIKEYIEQRLNAKLKRYFRTIVDAHVVVLLQRFEHICEITLNTGGVTLHGHEKTNDLYISVDKVVEKLERQLKKHKQKLRNHRTKANPDETSLSLRVDVLDGQDVDSSSTLPQIIYTKQFDLKPMSVDEAATQMDLFNQEFLVFVNSKVERINVLYRRKDGNYCLIDPKL
ncbi:MAG: ribosome-associated translation inhibitor RaiA [bacterium]